MAYLEIADKSRAEVARKGQKSRRGQGEIFSEPMDTRLNLKLTKIGAARLRYKAKLVGVNVGVLVEILARQFETYTDLVKLRQAVEQLGVSLDVPPEDGENVQHCEQQKR